MGDYKPTNNSSLGYTESVSDNTGCHNFNVFFNENIETKLPLIEVNIQGKICKALIDSGSSCNLVTQQVVDLLELNKLKKISISMNTVLGGEFKIKNSVDLTFRIENQDFEDNFYVTNGSLSSHFHIILGVPFIKKFDLLIDLKNNTLFYDNTGFSLLMGPSNNVNSIEVKPEPLPVFSKHKECIPPNSERIINVRIRKTNFIHSKDVLITPCIAPLRRDLLVGTSICENDANRLFIKIANLSDNVVHVNKGTKLGVLLPVISNYPHKQDEFTGHIDAENIGSMDHADLSWDSNVDLDHLNEPLRSEVRDFLNKNADIFASSVLDLPGCDTVKHEIRLKDEKPVKCKPYPLL